MESGEIKAKEAALKQFTSEQPTANLEKFKTRVTERSDCYEVWVTPMLPCLEEGGDTVLKFGGKSIFGTSMYYEIDKQYFTIKKQKFTK